MFYVSADCIHNIILTFSEKKKIGDVKVKEGVPVSLQSALFTLLSSLLSSCYFPWSHRHSMASALKHVPTCKCYLAFHCLFTTVWGPLLLKTHALSNKTRPN